MQKLADILPCGGHALLAQTTRILHHSDRQAPSARVDLFGNGVEILFNVYCDMEDDATGGFVDWFSDQTAILFGQMEELEIGGYPFATGFHINAFALENLRVL